MLTPRATLSYRRSLKSFMGYVTEGRWASAFDCSALTILGQFLDEDAGVMEDFLKRYPIAQRTRRRAVVRRVVLQWLADIAAGD